jgi:hypothetical protein
MMNQDPSDLAPSVLHMNGQAINQVFGSVIGVIQAFPMEKAIVMRERAAKSYRV